MDIVELIRNADSAPEILNALSVYVESLRVGTVIPEWCLQLPLRGEEDVAQRMVELIGVVNLTSQNLLNRECAIAKQALRVFAVASWRLRLRRRQRERSGS
jgi:hypothetical protein